MLTPLRNAFIIEFTVVIYVSLNIVRLLRKFATFIEFAAWLVCLSLTVFSDVDLLSHNFYVKIWGSTYTPTIESNIFCI